MLSVIYSHPIILISQQLHSIGIKVRESTLQFVAIPLSFRSFAIEVFGFSWGLLED
jgi:hypothetical protein